MNIHEYQSKAILREFGVPFPVGRPAFSPEEAAQVAKDLPTKIKVVKAQIHAGGRGKAGGVKLANSIEEVKRYAHELLGKILVTHQTGPQGKQVQRLLIEAGSNIAKEYYLSFVVDRASARIVMMGSEEGGMDIEEVAATRPEKILKEYIDPAVGLQIFQARRMAYAMNFKQEVIGQVTDFMMKLYNVVVAKDCSLVEINPMVVTKEDQVIALDAKLNFDDSGLFRHHDIQELRDLSEEDPKEVACAKMGLSYVTLDGSVACMVNGAGLAMATVDIIKYYGGEPANFLDVGGDSTVEKISEAFRIMQSDEKVKSIFVNIFGGINRCDVIAGGIVEAARKIGLKLPVVVRLDGTNYAEGRAILAEAKLPNVHVAAKMDEGAELVVKLAKEA